VGFHDLPSGDDPQGNLTLRRMRGVILRITRNQSSMSDKALPRFENRPTTPESHNSDLASTEEDPRLLTFSSLSREFTLPLRP